MSTGHIELLENRYTLNQEGELYDKTAGRFLKPDTEHRYRVLNKDGEAVRVSIKDLYRQEYGKEYCVDDIVNSDGEEWVQMTHHDDRFYISNLGRVKSYCGYAAKILTQEENDRKYQRVYINGKHYLVSRLVAEYFVQNEHNKPIVHHQDLNRANNNAHNLQWVNQTEHLTIHKQLRKRL